MSMITVPFWRGADGAADAVTMPRAVIFDMDGVLIDSFSVMRQAFAVAYREVVGDGTPPFEEYSKHLGRYFPDIMDIMGLPHAMMEPFVRESNRLADQVLLFEGVVDLLESLRERGLWLSVATGKSGSRARALLHRLDVLHLFDYVIGSDEIARSKPAPDIVLRALELMDVRAAEALMIGDSWTDLASARSAGVTALAALWAKPDEEPLRAYRPIAMLRHPVELLDFCPAGAVV